MTISASRHKSSCTTKGQVFLGTQFQPTCCILSFSLFTSLVTNLTVGEPFQNSFDRSFSLFMSRKSKYQSLSGVYVQFYLSPHYLTILNYHSQSDLMADTCNSKLPFTFNFLNFCQSTLRSNPRSTSTDVKRACTYHF